MNDPARSCVPLASSWGVEGKGIGMAESRWWKRGIVYQIYPRSFQDSNGDGIGDLKGICRRLGYLTWLGVDAIWISPIYPSPMADFGYDIADYCGIDARFGTLEDFDQLVAEAHGRGLKLILDYVPNHTSEEHRWFIDSRTARDSARRDWYIWRDPAPDGGPPNNWISNFGGSAWEFDEPTGQYYYHAFLKEQPDLNWRNRAVREAMHEVLRFWMRRGVDGFRVDVMWHLMKDDQFRDNPPNPAYEEGQPEINRLLQKHSADHPDVHEVVRELRGIIDEFPERVLIGEIYLPIERLVAYYGEDLGGAHLPFNFQLLQTAWHASTIAALIAEYEQALPEGGWPNWVLGNHDKPRIASRVGPEQARVAAMLLLTLRGTPTMYYGDEIGMTNVAIPPDAVQDPWARNEPGLDFGRDPQRTPMQWNGAAAAGFTQGDPWLPLSQDHAMCNVEALMGDERSILCLYRRLIELRSGSRALSIGDFALLDSAEDILLYRRSCGEEHLTVALNFARAEKTVDLPPPITRTPPPCRPPSTAPARSRGRTSPCAPTKA
jgi:alpha-glucosidase